MEFLSKKPCIYPKVALFLWETGLVSMGNWPCFYTQVHYFVEMIVTSRANPHHHSFENELDLCRLHHT